MGETDETTTQTKLRIDQVTGEIEGLRWAIETETTRGSHLSAELEKLTWSPAVPVF
jgi:hypothetical protein